MERLYFYECEHNGDLNDYLGDMRECGAIIVNSEIDYNEETAVVDFSVDDMDEFMKKFEETDSYDFIN